MNVYTFYNEHYMYEKKFIRFIALILQSHLPKAMIETDLSKKCTLLVPIFIGGEFLPNVSILINKIVQFQPAQSPTGT